LQIEVAKARGLTFFGLHFTKFHAVTAIVQADYRCIRGIWIDVSANYSGQGAMIINRQGLEA
jgi:hypothetical protein